MTSPTGLRDLKKAATRDALGMAAVRLGKEHGFDAVTADDIAVLYNAQPAADIDIHPLRDEELLLVEPRPPGLSEDPPTAIGLREVAELPLVIPSRPNAIRMQVETEMANIGCRPTVALEIDGVSAILDLVADGAGAALLSRNAVASSIRPSAYRIRSVNPPLKTRLCLATSSQRPATLTQQKTLELIRQTLDALNAR